MSKIKDQDTIDSRMAEASLIIRWADKYILRMLNNDAIKDDRRRSVTRELINGLEGGLKYPVSVELLHNDDEMRVGFFSPNTGMFYIDMSLNNFNCLPTISISGESTANND